MSAEQNKALARRVYEIVSTGDFGRAEEIVDQDAPDNELLPHDRPPSSSTPSRRHSPRLERASPTSASPSRT
jgi:hypothetical protein